MNIIKSNFNRKVKIGLIIADNVQPNIHLQATEVT